MQVCFSFLKLNQTKGLSWLENVENVHNIFFFALKVDSEEKSPGYTSD